MNQLIHTDNAPQPFSNYSQAVLVPAGHDVLHVSGQVGVDREGRLPADAREQHMLAWHNVVAILRGAGMDKADIVSVTALVTDHDQVGLYREIRDAVLVDLRPASTLVMAGLANPDWKVEIAVIAAKAAG